MRWKAWVVGLAVLGAAVAGCKQQIFLTECDLQCSKGLLLPPSLETDPSASVEPATATASLNAPSTVNDPERPIRHLSLAEAIAMALESGNIGSTNPTFPGQASDTFLQFTGRGVFGGDNIRVLALDPAIVGADIEASLAKFDARFVGSMSWSNQDTPIGTALQAFQAGNSGVNAIETQSANLSAAFLKPLPTGGVAGITFKTDYQLSNLTVARVNPSYTPALQFQFEQPLLQGFGVEINQLRPSHPGSVLTPFNTGGRVEGILITRIRFDQQRAEFERQVQLMLLNVEAAYWNLYAAYWNLYSREAALRQAFEAWKINAARFQAGRIAIEEYAQTRGQYELFRSQRITALGQVLENERVLRLYVGLPAEDGTRLVPADQPTLAPYKPDWQTSLNESLALRPDLVLARDELKARQLDLILQRNSLMPDLRFTATYDITGIGTRLDGPEQTNALRSLASNHFNDWQLGLRADIPLGWRDAHAAVRVARLNLARSYRQLQDQERKAAFFLERQYRVIFETHNQIQALRAQRQAFAQQIQARFEQFRAGRGTLDILLEAQRFWADALANEYRFIADYNTALAAFEQAKGTIMQYDNVLIAEGPLPHCAQVRAVEHERERSKALVLRERERPVPHPECDYENGKPGVLTLPENEAPSLPALMKDAPPVPKDAPLPAPLPKNAEPIPAPKKAPGQVSLELEVTPPPKPTLMFTKQPGSRVADETPKP